MDESLEVLFFFERIGFKNLFNYGFVFFADIFYFEFYLVLCLVIGLRDEIMLILMFWILFRSFVVFVVSKCFIGYIWSIERNRELDLIKFRELVDELFWVCFVNECLLNRCFYGCENLVWVLFSLLIRL